MEVESVEAVVAATDYTDIISAIDACGELLKISVFTSSVLIGLLLILIFAVAFNWRA